MKSIGAFILAAGRGERLLPITYHLPKPLLPILGRPVIELIISRLSLLNVERLAVNACYKRDLLAAFLAPLIEEKKATLFPEDPILGTGGALKNAESFLGQGIFITHNADIISSVDLARLLDHHSSSGNIATLAVHHYPIHNNVWINDAGHLLHVGQTPPPAGFYQCVAFTGIAAYSPEFLAYLPEGPSRVTDGWLSAAASGRVGTLDFSGCDWTDIGTPSAYAAAVFSALAKDGEALYIHPGASCGEASPEALTVLEEGVRIWGSPRLRNCILMPGTHITGSPVLANRIVGPDYSIQLTEQPPSAAGLPNGLLKKALKGPYTPALIGAGGSDRLYYRISNGDRSVVLMESPAGDKDFERHIVFSRFLGRLGLPVPELIATEDGIGDNTDRPMKRYGVFEDLGDLSLYSWLKCRRDPHRVAGLYERVVDLLVLLHTGITDQAEECPLMVSRFFDYDHLRWETTYFLEQFVRGLRDIPAGGPGLDAEFHRLAVKVSAFPRTVVHRDFQSQNIMITPGDTPHIIDYQGARLGPPAYDLASILWDPYAPLAPDLRTRLLSYYSNSVRRRSSTFDDGVFLTSLMPCRLQRHMQALGAYSFLARAKGKSSFLRFIPPCLELLQQESLAARDEYPLLYSLVRTLHDSS